MSAYFVEAATIDRIMTAWRTARAVVGLYEIPGADACTAAGRVLLSENARSVSFRYQMAGGEEAEEMSREAIGYSYNLDAHQLPAVSDSACPRLAAAVLIDGVSERDKYSKFSGLVDFSWPALAELDYQACEADDYSDTAACELVKCITAECLAALDLMLPAIKDAARKSAEQKRDAERIEMKARVEKLKLENPHLTPGGREVVEKNIRAALKLAFPGVKFSVRKRDYYATSVNWTDGPTVEEVDAIVRMHKAGSFDGMTDCYEYRSTAFGNAFGAVRYVSTSREYSDAATLAAIEQVAERYGVAAIGIDEYRRTGWNSSPISGACEIRDMWCSLVRAALEGKA